MLGTALVVSLVSRPARDRQFGQFGHVEQTSNGQYLSYPLKTNPKIMYKNLPRKIQ